MEEKEIELLKELQKDFERWDTVNRDGAMDPNWEDGVNLNLIRNHIIFDKRKMDESFGDKEKPPLYFRPTPEEVDHKYMVKKDEIIAQAKITHQVLSELFEAKELLKADNYLTVREQQHLGIEITINRLQGLGEAIEEGDVLTMRVLGWNTKNEVESVIKAYDSLMSREMESEHQMSIFEL